MKVFEKIYSIVSRIPKEKVMTYGQVGKLIGVNPRIVGFALNKNKNPQTIPCHRVVKSNGSLANGYAFGGKKMQKKKLEEEGIIFDEDLIDLKIYLYNPPQTPN